MRLLLSAQPMKADRVLVPQRLKRNLSIGSLLEHGRDLEEARMSDNPLCPNCGRTMRMTRTLPAEDEEPESHVFQCTMCQVNFITEDHFPIAGPLPH